MNEKGNPVTIKAWVTRSSAFSIQCGGLERLFIHFTKPTYVLEKLEERDRDTPFGYIPESEGLFKRHGWLNVDPRKHWVKSSSVGQFLGYDNPVSDYIWGELKNHFNNEPFETWHDLEKTGNFKIEDFLLELDLEIKIKQ